MVSRRRVRSNGDSRDDPGHDRAQLLLIGAITLAFIILGLVVVVNSVLLTETLSSGDSGRSGSQAATVEHELEAGIGGIAHRGNLRWDELGYDTYNGTLREVIEDDGFRSRYQNVTGNSRPVIVNVSVDGIPENQQARARTDESVNGRFGSLVTNRRIGHLSFDLQSNGDDATVTVEKATGDSIEIREVTVDGEPGFEITDETNTKCVIGNDRAEIDLVTGAVNATVDGSCDRRFIDPSTPTTVTIDGDTDASGTYDIVAKRDSEIINDGSIDPHAAWAVDVTVTYDSSDVSYERPYRVFLYGDRS